MKLFIKFVLSVYLPALITLAMACAPAGAVSNNTESDSANTVSLDKRISLLDGKVSFVAPNGFKPLTKKQLKRNLPDNAKLLLLLANADQTGSITVSYDDGMDFKPEQLIEIKKFSEETFRTAGAEWLTSEIVEINGRQWFHFEWEKPEMDDLAKLVAPDPKGKKAPKMLDETPSRYHEYSTIFKGKLVSISFDAYVEHYPQLRDAYIKSIQSIQVKD